MQDVNFHLGLYKHGSKTIQTVGKLTINEEQLSCETIHLQLIFLV